MNKKLLVDVRPFQISRNKIDESIKENDGRLDYAFVFENPAGAAHIFTYAFTF